jgi:hypothetical protein
VTESTSTGLWYLLYLSAGSVTSTTRAHEPLRAVRCHHHSSQTQVGCLGLRRASRASRMQRHAVAPDGSPALDDDQRAAGDGGQGREQPGGGDG